MKRKEEEEQELLAKTSCSSKRQKGLVAFKGFAHACGCGAGEMELGRNLRLTLDSSLVHNTPGTLLAVGSALPELHPMLPIDVAHANKAHADKA
eukprot:613693-Pelagomonas_calceolata.AAC.2